MDDTLVDANRLLESLVREEAELQFATFTNDTALDLGLVMVQLAKDEQKAVTIDISRSGQQLFHFAMPGTAPDNDEWIVRKQRVVYRFHHSSYYMAVTYRRDHTSIDRASFLDPSEYSAFGGAFPLLVQHVGVIGVIAVSGLPDDHEDHAFVVRALRTFFAS